MRRRRHHLVPPAQNLDSFLDILTNTVGVLMFIGLFVSLVAAEAGTLVRTPLAADSRKYVHFLEARENQTFDLSATILTVQARAQDYVAALPECREPAAFFRGLGLDDPEIRAYRRCLESRIQRIEDFSTATDDYRATALGDGMLYSPRYPGSGETPEEMERSRSEFRQLLKDLHPGQDYLAFIVRPDSFEAFRKARQIAREEGFDVGWEPFPQDGQLVFSSSGRSIGVQ